MLDNLGEELTEDDLRFGDLVRRFENRGFGPLLLVPALITLLPTGAIPGVASMCAVTLFILCIQVALGRHSPWIPKRLQNQSIPKEKLLTGVGHAQPYIYRMEKLFRPRGIFLSVSPGKNLVAVYCGVAALCMIPLEFVPFAVTLPSLALAITAIGMANHDGLFIFIGMMLQLGTAYLVVTTLIL
ncbi:ABC transporter permease [Alteromonas halophila]|uniref:ABC transporter permease n=2 Tax=Alteromonas halophila TaxID=516698 RepID=A0A918JNG6_9ALTE|nr:ABC transporter permease [Alteromonas halophila]